MKPSKIYTLITFVITLCLLSSCSTNSNADLEAAAVKKPPSPDTIAKAEQLFDERQDVQKLRDAISLLKQLRTNNARTFEVEWKFSRDNFCVAHYTTDDKERDKAFEDGKAAGKAAMQLEPDKVDGYFWYGANLGEQASRSPVTVGITSVNEIRDVMTKAANIDPSYELASPYDVLGRLELDTDIMGGTPARALEYLEKALALEKNNGNIHLDLAETYLALKNPAEAKKHLDYILTMKPHSDYLPEYDEQVAKAKQLLRTRF